MVIKELAHLLDLYYNTGKDNREIATMILCFGIKYAKVIREKQYMPEDIVQCSSIKDTQYAIEIRKGMNLAEYVCLKDGVLSVALGGTSKTEDVVGTNGYELDWVEEKLRAVGKMSFVRHLYPELKKNISVTVEEVAAKYSEFSSYGLDSQRSKLASARTIFKAGKEREALENISESRNVDEDTRCQALSLLKC